MFGIDAVLRGFSIIDENYRDVVAELFSEADVAVDVDFAESGAEFGEERLDDGLGVFAEVAAGTTVEGDERTSRGHRFLGSRGGAEVKVKKFKVRGSRAGRIDCYMWLIVANGSVEMLRKNRAQHDALYDSRFRVGEFLEGAGVGVEGVGAVELGDLADVAQVVIGQFVEHL